MAKVVYVGSFFNGAGDIVDEILQAFRQLFGADAVSHYDPELYSRGANKSINLVSLAALEPYLSAETPLMIVMAAGGLCPQNNLRVWAKAHGVPIVSLQLSDPDDYLLRGKEIANCVDLIATNSLDSLNHYKQVVHAVHMPFGCTDRGYDVPRTAPVRYDVCIVGEARPERIKLARELTEHGVSLNIHGRYWAKWRAPFKMSSLPVPTWRPRYVTGSQKYHAIADSYIYLSFCRTLAGYTNIKVGFYEALSVGAIVALDADEKTFERELGGYPLDICRFDSAKDVVEKLRELKKLPHDQFRAARERNRCIFLENFTWEKRLKTLLSIL